MAIKDTAKKPFLVDNNTDVFIGLDLPFYKSDGREGWFASTGTTIEAVKNNIRNLLNTHQGERLMQPTLGLNLRKYLFEQIDEEVIVAVEDDILQTLSIWLPFVQVKDMEINTAQTNPLINPNTMIIDIVFNIVQDPTTLTSVQVTVDGGVSGGNER